MQAKRVELRPEIHPHSLQAVVPPAFVTPCSIGFMTSLQQRPVVLCSAGDVICRPAGGWTPFADATDRCVSRDPHQLAREVQEPVDLSLHGVNQSSSTITYRQTHPAMNGTYMLRPVPICSHLDNFDNTMYQAIHLTNSNGLNNQ